MEQEHRQSRETFMEVALYYFSVLIAHSGNYAFRRSMREGLGGQPMPGTLGELMWQLAGLVCWVLLLGLFVAGFFFESWWHPPLAIVVMGLLAGYLSVYWGRRLESAFVAVASAVIAAVCAVVWIWLSAKNR